MKNTLLVLCLMGCAAFAACKSSAPPGPSAGSQTHFLDLCDSTCAAPYTCLCGMCTLACTADLQCHDAAPSARCLAPAVASSHSCTPEAVCDLGCGADADCRTLGSGYTCSGKRCRAGRSPTGNTLRGHDAAALDDSDSGKLVDRLDAAVDGGFPARDAAALGLCNDDSDCVFRTGASCCGACQPLQDPIVKATQCFVDCTAPPGGCSCVDHHCERGVLQVGAACDPAQDACGTALGCCPMCPLSVDGGSCTGPTCQRIALPSRTCPTF